jgi:hypothetical protein
MSISPLPGRSRSGFGDIQIAIGGLRVNENPANTDGPAATPQSPAFSCEFSSLMRDKRRASLRLLL